MRRRAFFLSVATGLAFLAAVPPASPQVCATMPGGCPGSASPYCAAPPTVGNAAFGIGLPPLACLPPTAPITLLLSFALFPPIPLAMFGLPTVVPGCTMAVMPTILVPFPPPILPTPIPPDPFLVGTVLFAQAACFDPVMGVLSMSGVLSITVG